MLMHLMNQRSNIRWTLGHGALRDYGCNCRDCGKDGLMVENEVDL